jgi:hypothetical protein
MRRWRRVAMISSFYPWVGMLIVIGTALHAWHLLGHWPRIYVDDPKFVAGLGPMYVLVMTCLFGFPFGLFINAGATFMVFIHAEFRGWRQYAAPLAIASVGWTLWVILIKNDPGQIYIWLGD